MNSALKREYDDLKANAVIFWPSELAEREHASSIIPLLLDTQDKFISLLHVADTRPDAWKEILPATAGLPANLFLKHIMVLSDVGGEKLKRFKTELPSVFDANTMQYVWRENTYDYRFQTLAGKGNWGNVSLCVDGPGLQMSCPLSPLLEDVIMLLLFGSTATSPDTPDVILERCILGTLLGNKAELNTFVRQRYIWVSRITGGATANTMGHLAQAYVKERLMSALPDWDFSRSSIPGISHSAGRTQMAFDIVAQSPSGKYCAIEISFQVTTNSTIERKAGQARARQSLLHRKGHQIAYVIDGAGNFERRSALSTICRHSDCAVTFDPAEIERLVTFLRGMAE
ncbi:MAG: restriction endonuclease [Planctomycetota bacterium]